MTTRASSRRRYGDRVRVAGEEYVLLPAAEYPRLKGTGRRVVFDAVEILNWLSGRDLRRDRKAAGLTQAEVARRAHIRPETLSRLENGRGNPTVRTVARILRAIGRARRGARRQRTLRRQ